MLGEVGINVDRNCTVMLCLESMDLTPILAYYERLIVVKIDILTTDNSCFFLTTRHVTTLFFWQVNYSVYFVHGRVNF